MQSFVIPYVGIIMLGNMFQGSVLQELAKIIYTCFLENKKEWGEVLEMDHVVYLEAKARELENLLNGKKTMIIRGATGRKLPYGRVNADDVLYLINNDGEGLIRAKTIVRSVLNSNKMTQDESIKLVRKNQDKLQLTDKQFKRWAGKRYIVLIEVKKVEKVSPFTIDRSNFGNMDDWLLMGNISDVKVKS